MYRHGALVQISVSGSSIPKKWDRVKEVPFMERAFPSMQITFSSRLLG
jgi:hypothetical protein